LSLSSFSQLRLSLVGDKHLGDDIFLINESSLSGERGVLYPEEKLSADIRLYSVKSVVVVLLGRKERDEMM